MYLNFDVQTKIQILKGLKVHSPFFFKVEKDDVNNFWPDVLDSIFFPNAPTLGV